MSEELSKIYSPKEIEEKWYRIWEEKGYFNAQHNDDKPGYSIVVPPPNVTGILHMGHMLNNSIQDTVVRWKRMKGFDTLWLPGTDHAGIATQNKVEKWLAENNTSKEEIGRDAFLEKIWEWKEKHGGLITNQLRKLGSSLDWSRERFTMDEGLSKAVREVFVNLYNDGLIYKGEYIVNWCPHDKTALADDEIDIGEQGNAGHVIGVGEEEGDGLHGALLEVSSRAVALRWMPPRSLPRRCCPDWAVRDVSYTGNHNPGDRRCRRDLRRHRADSQLSARCWPSCRSRNEGCP